jgi:hypothetical protein
VRPPRCLRVVVISPLRAIGEFTAEHNEAFALNLCLALVRAGFAPFAPHGFYPRFLDDRNTTERAQGMAAGAAWLYAAERAFVDVSRGVSSGMVAEIELCSRAGIPMVIRRVDADLVAAIERLRL